MNPSAKNPELPMTIRREPLRQEKTMHLSVRMSEVTSTLPSARSRALTGRNLSEQMNAVTKRIQAVHHLKQTMTIPNEPSHTAQETTPSVPYFLVKEKLLDGIHPLQTTMPRAEQRSLE